MPVPFELLTFQSTPPSHRQHLAMARFPGPRHAVDQMIREMGLVDEPVESDSVESEWADEIGSDSDDNATVWPTENTDDSDQDKDDQQSTSSSNSSDTNTSDSGADSSDSSAEDFTEYFPGAAKTFGKGPTLFSRIFDSDEFAEQRLENKFYPFSCQTEWEMVAWLSKYDLSLKATDEYLRLKYVRYTVLLCTSSLIIIC